MKQLYLMMFLFFFAGCHYVKSPEMRLCSRLDWEFIVDAFPKNTQQVYDLEKKSVMVMNEMIQRLQDLSGKQRTFYNTVRAYDNAKFKFVMNQQILSTLAALTPDRSVQSAAHHALVNLEQYQSDHLVRNKIILDAFQDYAHFGNDDQSKSVSVRLFLQKTINRLEHEGTNLSAEKIKRLSKLSKEISSLKGEFSYQISNNRKSIDLSRSELTGVPDQFLNEWEKNKKGYNIPLNYESFFAVLENCTIAETRKKFFIAFNKRTYPQNLKTLKSLITEQNKYANIVGYENFAEYECSSLMIGSVGRARNFINDIIKYTHEITKKDLMKLREDLPMSVKLSRSGKLEPWDEAFVKTSERKKYFDINEQELSQYFPLSHVMHELQKQFSQFFALSFESISDTGLWHKDLISIQVRLLKTNKIIGYLVFDLYARPGKSDEAHQMSVIPTIHDDCNVACSGLAVIVTNFTKAPENKETLLNFNDVKTLLHEFGHGLHELFGATEFVDIAGTKVPRDFVEAPAQLFEMWMDNPKMVKMFSQHYITKKQLSNEMIEKIISAEKFGRASLLERQCLLSLISLELGCSHGAQDPHEIVGKIYKEVRPDVEYNSQDYFETSFAHLINYGSYYYGYVWSQVLAAELFEYVSENGITNHQVGQKIYELLLSHGGSKDPQALIEVLLGSSVTNKALLDSLSS